MTLPSVTIKLFRPGKEVIYKGWAYSVKYTQISRNGLLVYLEGLADPIPENLLDVTPTVIDFEAARKQKDEK